MSVFWLHFEAKLVPKGGLGDLKKVKKIEKKVTRSKNTKKHTQKRVGFFVVFRGKVKKWSLGSFWFRAPLRDRFWMDFGCILDGFWMIFVFFGAFLD